MLLSGNAYHVLYAVNYRERYKLGGIAVRDLRDMEYGCMCQDFVNASAGKSLVLKSREVRSIARAAARLTEAKRLVRLGSELTRESDAIAVLRRRTFTVALVISSKRTPLPSRYICVPGEICVYACIAQPTQRDFEIYTRATHSRSCNMRA